MKSTKLTTFVVLLATLALLVAGVVGITASAEEAVECDLAVSQANLVYNDVMHIAFTLSGSAPEGTTPGVIFWLGEQAEYTVENAAATDFTYDVSDDKQYYKTPGIAIANIDTVYYYAACYKTAEGNIFIAEEANSYSIIEYAGVRIVTDGITKAQSNLYAGLLAYGAASEDVITNEISNPSNNYACVKTVGGTIGSFGATMGGWAGHSVLLRAEAVDADGKYFLYWEKDGQKVSELRLFTVTAPEDGIDTYTAVYGDKADSVYVNANGLQDKAVGSTGTTVSDYVKISRGKGKLYITESLGGDRELFYERLEAGTTSNNSTFSIESVHAGTVAAEMDVTFHTFNTSSSNYTLRIGISNGGTSKTYRIGLERAKGSDTVSIKAYDTEAETSNFTLYDDNGEAVKYDVKAGETLTFGVAVETVELSPEIPATEEGGEATPAVYETYVKFYIDGQYLGKYNLSEIPDFVASGATVASTSALTFFRFNGLNPSQDNLSFDNFAFFAANPYN